MNEEQLKLFDLPDREGGTHTFKPLRYPVWTENKARLIARYLYYFVLITKHGTYIDGFAGPQKPDMPETWAARLVLESKPARLRSFYLCDVDEAQAEALLQLREQYHSDGRLIEVRRANFNEWIHEILISNRLGPKVACFCLLDQRTFECHWSTVEKIAGRKGGMKIEIFYFVGTGWIGRALNELEDKSVVERWWGRKDVEGFAGANRTRASSSILPSLS